MSCGDSGKKEQSTHGALRQLCPAMLRMTVVFLQGGWGPSPMHSLASLLKSFLKTFHSCLFQCDQFEPSGPAAGLWGIAGVWEILFKNKMNVLKNLESFYTFHKCLTVVSCNRKMVVTSCQTASHPGRGHECSTISHDNKLARSRIRRALTTFRTRTNLYFSFTS